MRLQAAIDLLREYTAASSFTPSGGVSGAHSYPGPEPGRVGAFPLGYAWPEQGGAVPKKVQRLPGQFREKIRKVRKWRAPSQ